MKHKYLQTPLAWDKTLIYNIKYFLSLLYTLSPLWSQHLIKTTDTNLLSLILRLDYDLIDRTTPHTTGKEPGFKGQHIFNFEHYLLDLVNVDS